MTPVDLSECAVVISTYPGTAGQVFLPTRKGGPNSFCQQNRGESKLCLRQQWLYIKHVKRLMDYRRVANTFGESTMCSAFRSGKRLIRDIPEEKKKRYKMTEQQPPAASKNWEAIFSIAQFKPTRHVPSANPETMKSYEGPGWPGHSVSGARSAKRPR